MVRRVRLVSSPRVEAAALDAITRGLAARGIAIVATGAVDALPPGPPTGIDAVIAAGGDGTIGSVVTWIGDAPVALGIVPLGTANDTARSLGLPLEVSQAVALIAQGEPTPIDCGLATDAEGRSGRFLHAASIGVNAEFARLATDPENRDRWGALTYPASLLQALASSRAVQVHLDFADGTTFDGAVLQVSVLNLPTMFGNTLAVNVPELGPSDGQLAFLMFCGPFEVRRVDAVAARIEADEPRDVTLDGELRLRTPIEVRLCARRLPVLLPRAPADP